MLLGKLEIWGNVVKRSSLKNRGVSGKCYITEIILASFG